jgi:hypothetical protein
MVSNYIKWMYLLRMINIRLLYKLEMRKMMVGIRNVHFLWQLRIVIRCKGLGSDG